jgi:hypothetical protein
VKQKSYMVNLFLDPREQKPSNDHSEIEGGISHENNEEELSEADFDIDEYEEDFDHGDDYDSYGRSGEKYGWYNGWSDDAIDDAFEGDPENTWNVD